MLGLPKACLMPKQNYVLRSDIADLSLDFEGPVPKRHKKLHGLQTAGEKIALTARQKLKSQSQVYK